MNTYQQVMIVVAAFWFIWSLEILYRKKNWSYEENKIGERIAWVIFTAVMTIAAVILDVLRKL